MNAPDGQEALFQGSAAMLDPRQYTPEGRARLLDPAFNRVMTHNGGTYWLTGGAETNLLWEATLNTFVSGIWVAAIVCAQATCE